MILELQKIGSATEFVELRTINHGFLNPVRDKFYFNRLLHSKLRICFLHSLFQE